ncbi:hydrogenase isoenzymes formation protein [Escherichia coli]|nr:hydrogenase isoenzymes formation protein [Escherichia coli]
METLKAVVTSMAETARAAGIAIVTGDTKVVQRGAADNCLSTPLAWAQFRRIFTGAHRR